MRGLRVSGRVRIVLGVACLPVYGCGFLFTEGPPAGHEQMAYFSCTESSIGPSLDYLSAGLNLLGAVLTLQDETVQERNLVVTWNLAWGAFMLTSGLVGDAKVDDCRRAKTELAGRLTRLQGIEVDSPDYGWRTLAHWSGSGNQTAGTFTSSGPHWRVTWTASNPGHGAFMYIAIEDESGRQVSRGAVQRGEGNGALYVDALPGLYSLEVVAVNLQWDVKVEQR